MKNLIINIISANNNIVLNKTLIKHFKSLELACVLSFLIDEWARFNCEDFYYTISKLKDETCLTEGKIRTCIKKLIEANILIKKGFKGLPAKRYYNVNYDEVINILNCGESVYKKENNNPINEVENKDNNRDYEKIKDELKEELKKEIEKEIRKEIINDIKDFKEKVRDEIKKEVEKENVKEVKKETRQKLRQEALNLYKENKREIGVYFSYEDWQDWVDYKLKRERSLTLLTFKKNIKQLIGFRLNAKKSLEQSIGSNWSGLFEVKGSNVGNNDIDFSLMFERQEADEEELYAIECMKNGLEYIPKSKREKLAKEEAEKEKEEQEKRLAILNNETKEGEIYNEFKQ